MKNHHIYSLISSIVSLVVTCGLLIVCLFAWYTNNKNVSANGIIGSTADSDYSFELEMYKDSSYSKINYEKIDLGYLNPGDIFYFRIKVSKKTKDSNTNLKFNIKFSGVESNLSENIAVNPKNNNFVSYKINDDKCIDLYKLNDDNKVLIKENEENKVLYEYDTTTNDISLVDYRIQDVFVVYSGLHHDTSYSDLEYNRLNEESEITKEDEDGNYYCYFALEFNEILSLKTIDGVESSNAYMFQNLIIKSIDIKEANTNE